MSGHSKWSTIKRAKGAADAKRGQLFTKLAREITVAARIGLPDPDANSRLRIAIQKARSENMPKDNIDRAIARASGADGGAQYEEISYEGYGPGGVAILVECATGNINRTYPEVRHAFTKHGGSIAEKGAVAFQFARKGVIRVKGSGDELMMSALDAGADDVQEADGESIIYTDSKELAKVRDNLKAAGVEVIEAELSYEPTNTIEVSDEATQGKIERLMDALDELDDVTNTYTNFDIV